MCGERRITQRSCFSPSILMPGDLTQVIRVGSKQLYPLSHLANPTAIVLM